MKDPFHPTLDEICKWASSNDLYPSQDWDIIVFDNVEDEFLADLVLDFAADQNCPQQESFLHFLNIMTGTVFFTKGNLSENKINSLHRLMKKAESFNNIEINDWINRSKNVIANPSSFEYCDWF